MRIARKELNMKTHAVELKANPGWYDYYTGTYEECKNYLQENGYKNWDTEKEYGGACIVEMEVDDNGTIEEIYNTYKEWEDE